MCTCETFSSNRSTSRTLAVLKTFPFAAIVPHSVLPYPWPTAAGPPRAWHQTSFINSNSCGVTGADPTLTIHNRPPNGPSALRKCLYNHKQCVKIDHLLIISNGTRELTIACDRAQPGALPAAIRLLILSSNIPCARSNSLGTEKMKFGWRATDTKSICQRCSRSQVACAVAYLACHRRRHDACRLLTRNRSDHHG